MAVSFSNFSAFGNIALQPPARRTTQERSRNRSGARETAEPESHEDAEAPAEPPPAVVVQRYDLVSRQQSGSIPVPFRSELIAVSPNGELVVTQIAGLGLRSEGEGRLDIWSFTDGEHVAAWRPFQQLEERGGGQKTVDAFFAGEQHLITRNFWGRTVCWKLPDCKAVWMLEDARALTVSPDGKVVAFAEAGVVRFVEAVTGEVVGQVPVSSNVYALSWHCDGRRLAAVGDKLAAVLDVHSGTVELEIPISDGGRQLQWCGDHGLLIDNGLYCDLEQQSILWEYELPVGVHLSETIDHRHWYIAASSLKDPTATLNAVELPGPHLEGRLARMNPEDVVLRPGATVSLQVSIGGGPGSLIQEVREGLTERLEKANVRVAGGQPVTVSVSAAQSSTGETKTFESFGSSRLRPGYSGDIRQDVNVNKVECRVAVLYQGRTLWEQKSTLTNNEIIVSGVKPENLQSYLDEGLWQQAADVVKNARVPKYVFRESTPTGLGKSQFLPGGLALAGT